MKNRNVGMIIGLSIATVAVYIAIKTIFRKQRKNTESCEDKKEGDRHYNSKDYGTAAMFYKKCIEHITDSSSLMEIYNNISYCYIKQKMYEESIKYLNKSLNINIHSNGKALKWRYECYKLLDMKKEYLKDLLLYYAYTKDEKIKKQGEDIMKEICENETKDFFIENKITLCDMEYHEISKRLVSLIDENPSNKILRLLHEGKYKELTKLLFEEQNDCTSENMNNIVVEDKERLVDVTKNSVNMQKTAIASQNSLIDKTMADEKEENGDSMLVASKDIVLEGGRGIATGNHHKNETSRIGTAKHANEAREKVIKKKRNRNNDKDAGQVLDKEIKNVVKAMVLFHMGFANEAMLLVKDSTFKYAKVVYNYVCGNVDSAKMSKTDIENTNITILYFLYKSDKTQIEFLERALLMIPSDNSVKYDFLYYEILMYYIDKQMHERIERIMTRLEFTSPCIIELMAEYYIKMREFQKAQELCSCDVCDPRINLAKALYHIEMDKKDEAENILRNTIVMYPYFYKAYLYLGNILFNKNLDESMKIFEQSYKACSSYDEVYITKQALLLAEIQAYIKSYN